MSSCTIRCFLLDALSSRQVDPGLFFKECVHDLCQFGDSEDGLMEALCIAMEAYARECARHRINLDWRNDGFCRKRSFWAYLPAVVYICNLKVLPGLVSPLFSSLYEGFLDITIKETETVKSLLLLTFIAVLCEVHLHLPLSQPRFSIVRSKCFFCIQTWCKNSSFFH